MSNPDISEATINELHEAIRVREHLLNEAAHLLAAGSGEDSPEYEEFNRLRKHLPTIDRAMGLTHAHKVVRQKFRELRTWIRKMDRALGTTDPVEGILVYMRKQMEAASAVGQVQQVALLSNLIVQIERGDWIEETDMQKAECQSCGKKFRDKGDLFQHCAYTECVFCGEDDG